MISRATRDANDSIENKMKDHVTLKKLPNLIQRGVTIAIAQRSVLFAAGETMLSASTKFITALLGNKIIPTYEIHKACHHGINKIAQLVEKINCLYEPIKKSNLALEEN